MTQVRLSITTYHTQLALKKFHRKGRLFALGIGRGDSLHCHVRSILLHTLTRSWRHRQHTHRVRTGPGRHRQTVQGFPEERRLGGGGGIENWSPVIGFWRWFTRDPISRCHFQWIVWRSSVSFGISACIFWDFPLKSDTQALKSDTQELFFICSDCFRVIHIEGAVLISVRDPYSVHIR